MFEVGDKVRIKKNNYVGIITEVGDIFKKVDVEIGSKVISFPCYGYEIEPYEPKLKQTDKYNEILNVILTESVTEEPFLNKENNDLCKELLKQFINGKIAIMEREVENE